MQTIIKINFTLLFWISKYQPTVLKGDKGPNRFSSFSFANLSDRAKRTPNPATKNIKPGNIKSILSDMCDPSIVWRELAQENENKAEQRFWFSCAGACHVSSASIVRIGDNCCSMFMPYSALLQKGFEQDESSIFAGKRGWTQATITHCNVNLSPEKRKWIPDRVRNDNYRVV